MNNTYENPLLLVSEETVFTGSWIKLGNTQDVRGFTCIGLFLDIVINDSQGIEIKVVGRPNENDATEYLLPVYAVTPEGLVEHIGTNYILSKNEDQSLIIKANTDNLIPFADIYIKAQNPGANPAILKHAYISKAWSMGGGR